MDMSDSSIYQEKNDLGLIPEATDAIKKRGRPKGSKNKPKNINLTENKKSKSSNEKTNINYPKKHDIRAQKVVSYFYDQYKEIYGITPSKLQVDFGRDIKKFTNANFDEILSYEIFQAFINKFFKDEEWVQKDRSFKSFLMATGRYIVQISPALKKAKKENQIGEHTKSVFDVSL